MKFIANCLILTVIFINSSLNAQQKSKKSPVVIPDFTSPMNIPLYLSGNYGEIRSAHFHTGVDIKTEQVEGKMVFAVDSGMVYRIGVRAGGYGNALYLKHPNGRVTVYGHLSRFIPVIENWVRDQQYKLKSFEVDLYPPSGMFVFSRGGLIAFSGSSGFSGGPHLHFEIRDKSGNLPLNVLKYHFQIRDALKPKLKWLAIYPMDDSSTVNGSSRKLIVKISGSNGVYYPVPGKFKVSGNIGFGIDASDYLDNSPNACSPYDISLFEDDKMHLRFVLDSIPFSLNGNVDSHVDFEEKLKTKKYIRKLYVEPNNLLPIYKIALNRGVIRFNDSLVHQMKISVADAYGNLSQLNFAVQSSPAGIPPLNQPIDPKIVALFRHDSLNMFEDPDIRVIVPREALFTDIKFSFDRQKTDTADLSDVFSVHQVYTPLNKAWIISIRPRYVPAGLESKLLVAGFDQTGQWTSFGGNYKNGYVTAFPKSFGRFFVAMDTLEPQIRPVSYVAGRKYAEGQVISFRITDRQSGIRKYSGYIDEKWALFEYDAINDLLSYRIDKSRLESGKMHHFVISVTDNKDNSADYPGTFFF